MIDNRSEYELELKEFYTSLSVLAVYKVNNHDVQDIADIEAIKTFYDSYQHILEMLHDFFADPAFKSVYSGAKDE